MPVPPLTTGCMLRCSFGAAPSPMTALPLPGKPTVIGIPLALVTDVLPIANVSTFGLCSAPTNPTVIAATAAALGVLTPMPCIPALIPPWLTPSPCVTFGGVPVATTASTVTCTWLGVVTVVLPAQTFVTV